MLSAVLRSCHNRPKQGPEHKLTTVSGAQMEKKKSSAPALLEELPVLDLMKNYISE